jgi:hypothetical protein
MSEPKLALISGVAHLTPKYRHMAETLHGPGFQRTVEQMCNDAVFVDGLARLLDRAFEHAHAADGRIDLREAAMFMIKEMRENQL